jgi:hypothetical protein
VAILQHNAHFRDNSCRFEHPLTLVLTTLAPRGLCDREPRFLGSCRQNLPPSLPLLPKYREPKMASHDLRAGSFKDGCLCSFVTQTSSTINRGAFPLRASLLPTVPRQSATYFLAHSSFFYSLSPLKNPDTLTSLVPLPGQLSALVRRGYEEDGRDQ